MLWLGAGVLVGVFGIGKGERGKDGERVSAVRIWMRRDETVRSSSLLFAIGSYII